MSAFVVWMVLHFLIAAMLAWLSIRYAVSRNMLDEPGDRRSHAIATPRGGGLGIVVAVLLGCAWMLVQATGQPPGLLLFMAGLVLVAGIGWWDDHQALSPGVRLVVQAVAAVLLSILVWQSSGTWWQVALIFCLAMALTNVWNFMDGINGLASLQAFIAASLIAALQVGPLGWLAAGLAAACLGFLPFNFPRARIFLGDVGSGALGFILAGMLAWAMMLPQSTGSWLLLMLPLAAFLVDASFTLAERMLAGERWWLPHVGHVYQRLARRVGHVPTTLGYGAFSLGGAFLALLMSNDGVWKCFPVVAGWYLLASTFWVLLRIGLGDKVKETGN